MSVFLNEAKRIADGYHAQKAQLQDQKLRLEDELRDVEARLQKADLASNRLATFREHVGGRPQCPSCWIIHEVATDLTAIPGNDREDKFRCHSCLCEFAVPF